MSSESCRPTSSRHVSLRLRRARSRLTATPGAMACSPPLTTWHFFFQAEDGIRDIGVTGVQTCALPICPARPFEIEHDLRTAWRRGRDRGSPDRVGYDACPGIGPRPLVRRDPDLGMIVTMELRSEERRVGKECRSRWSPYH